MNSIASLDSGARGILLRYIQIGGEHESVEETMASLGLTNKRYFYTCRSQVRKAGFLSDDGSLNFPTVPRAIPEPPPLYVQSVAANPLDLMLEDFAYEPAPVSTSPLVRAAEIDRMDDSGDIRKPSSPAQARRKAQVAFLQEQGTRLFDKYLSEPKAKELLVLGDESAEIVLGALETVPSGIEYPYGYARKKLEGEKRDQTPQPTVRTPSLEPAREPDYYITAPTKRIADKTAKLVALGLIPAVVEEDDE